MDGNGFTGFNPSAAKQDIQNYIKSVGESTKLLTNIIESLFTSLEKAWCSPKAKEFSRQSFPKLFQTLASFLDKAYDTYNSLIAAYNIIAAKHGAATIASEDTLGIGNLNAEQILSIMYDEWGGDPFLQEADPTTGAVGMNVKVVNMALNLFIGQVERSMEVLSSIPTEIAFYDTDGSQQMAFKTNVSQFVNAFKELFEKMANEISEATEQESDSIVNAASESAETLSQ